MTNRQIISKIIRDKSISKMVVGKIYNKALIFSEFVTNKYANEVYKKYLESRISAEDALFKITNISL